MLSHLKTEKLYEQTQQATTYRSCEGLDVLVKFWCGVLPAYEVSCFKLSHSLFRKGWGEIMYLENWFGGEGLGGKGGFSCSEI